MNSEEESSRGSVGQRSFDLPAEDAQATQYHRIAVVSIDDESWSFPTNDEFLDPDLQPQDELPEELLKKGIQNEITSIASFETFIQVPADSIPVPITQVIPSSFVNKWKNSAVKSRLVVQAYNQEVQDRDEIYAATPLISTLKILLLAVTFNWVIIGFDVNTAFLHALIPDDQPIFIWPPTKNSQLQTIQLFGNLRNHCTAFALHLKSGKIISSKCSQK